MQPELELFFPDAAHVVVRFNGIASDVLPFVSPLRAEDHRDIRWYLEIYGASSVGEPDDDEANRIVARLPLWGRALFRSVFQDNTSLELFQAFRADDAAARLISIHADASAVQALPWALLCDPSETGAFLFRERPCISIKRRVTRSPAARTQTRPGRRADGVHLLFVISRPTGADFLDPRADPDAVLDALEAETGGRCTWEFLPHATLGALHARVRDPSRPSIDILHFDGHGLFYAHGDSPAAGYLLFETDQGEPDYVSGERLEQALDGCGVTLVILSACQSATVVEQGEPLGSVAVRLVAGGIPSVLAMTHSVLAATTRLLFGELYRQLVRGHTIGTALDAARLHLQRHPERYEVWRNDPVRGRYRMPLALHDWFLPVLYQADVDQCLFQEEVRAPVSMPRRETRTNLPARPEMGFIGREPELWHIGRGFAAGTRRITLCGLRGQGKTALALEAGRWLTRTRMFEAAVWIDYVGVRTDDAVARALARIAEVLGMHARDAAAAIDRALLDTPILIILDNLDGLAPEPLRALLDAAATWSEIGESRVLLTARTSDFGHARYPSRGSSPHWHAAVSDLDGSISFMTAQAAESDDALERWLDQLDDTTRQDVARLGVFHGGGLETNLLIVTGLAPERARTGLSMSGREVGGTWRPEIGRQLESLGAMTVEAGPDASSFYARFHPALAPRLSSRLDPGTRERLTLAHRRHYYHFAVSLHLDSIREPETIRATASCELPNLWHAVNASLAARDPDAGDFALRMSDLLDLVGLRQEAEALTARALDVTEGSTQLPLRTKHGMQLLELGRHTDAIACLQAVLIDIGDTPSYDRATALMLLARCFIAVGQPKLAAARQEEALRVAAALDSNVGVARFIGNLHAERTEALAGSGRYDEAWRESMAAATDAGQRQDTYNEMACLARLGVLAMRQGRLEEAEQQSLRARDYFQSVGAAGPEAAARLQLGMIHEGRGDTDKAEECYRDAARLFEHHGQMNPAAETWSRLASLHARGGRLEMAEAWLRKVIQHAAAAQHHLGWFTGSINLATVLEQQPHRLAEARRLVEEARLSMGSSYDPNVVDIWQAYFLLGSISRKQAASAADAMDSERYELEARAWHRAARAAKRESAGTRHELREHAELILEVVRAVHDEASRDEGVRALRQHLDAVPDAGGQKDARALNMALLALLTGERDTDVLCDALNVRESMIVEAILAGLADPGSLDDLQASAAGATRRGVDADTDAS